MNTVLRLRRQAAKMCVRGGGSAGGQVGTLQGGLPAPPLGGSVAAARHRAPWRTALLGAIVVVVGCNKRVFERVDPVCVATIASDVGLPAEKAADILIVVDNSGSMFDEQQNLGANFIRVDGCPLPPERLAELTTCDDDEPSPLCRFKNPSKALLEAPGPDGLAGCGFVQVLAAFDNDFRVGVITTDVGQCDNLIPGGMGQLYCEAGDSNDVPPECTGPNRCLELAPAQGDRPATFRCEQRASDTPCVVDEDCVPSWGQRPQRGCLQPDGPPVVGVPHRDLRTIISRADLLDGDPANDDIAARIIGTLSNVRTFGTGEERGLDAAVDFLERRAPSTGCEDDRDSFLRDDASLIVIFLTDEEDCSRLDGETAGAPFASFFPGDVCEPISVVNNEAARACYQRVGDLTPVSRYVARLQALKANPADVRVAVIAGVDPETQRETGCLVDDDGEPDVACYPTSGFASTASVCGPVPTDEDARLGRGCDDDGCAIPCCLAEPGSRYVELANAMEGLTDSICRESFQETMIRIAVFIADVDTIKLAQPVADPRLVFVEKVDGDTTTLLPRLTTTSCGDDNGWILESDTEIRLCGSARPLAGETISVRARGAGAESEDGTVASASACADRSL